KRFQTAWRYGPRRGGRGRPENTRQADDDGGSAGALLAARGSHRVKKHQRQVATIAPVRPSAGPGHRPVGLGGGGGAGGGTGKWEGTLLIMEVYGDRGVAVKGTFGPGAARYKGRCPWRTEERRGRGAHPGTGRGNKTLWSGRWAHTMAGRGLNVCAKVCAIR